MIEIPVNGVFVSPTFYPIGFYVAKYDAEGFASEPRWFPDRAAADGYKSSLLKGDS